MLLKDLGEHYRISNLEVLRYFLKRIMGNLTITADREETVQLSDGGIILVVPAWRWMLSRDV